METVHKQAQAKPEQNGHTGELAAPAACGPQAAARAAGCAWWWRETARRRPWTCSCEDRGEKGDCVYGISV